MFMQTHRIYSQLLLVLLVLIPWKAAAEDIKYLARPEQSLAAIVTEIEGATTSIDVATFIFEPCHASTQILLDMLAKKAKAGVRVRILLDDLQQKGAQQTVLVDFAAKNGFEFRFFNKNEMNMRLHIKMLVVDGKSFVSGGRNLSDEYFGYSEENNYVDRDLLVKGAAATQASTSFQELWTSSLTAKKAGRAAGFSGWQKHCGQDYAARIAPLRKYLETRAAEILNQVPTRRCASVSFKADAPDFLSIRYSEREATDGRDFLTPMRLERKRSTKAVLGYMDGARSSLAMENWVFMPIYQLGDAFDNARARKVKIDVLTNRDIEDGPQFFREAMDYAIEVFSGRHSKGTQKVTLISSKGSLSSPHELTPANVPVHLHGKIMLRDERDLLVGSFNLDSRSMAQNLEQAIVVPDCPALVADARAGFNELVETHRRDVEMNLVPPKKAPSLFAKWFAMVTLVFY